jgi:FkbM family methyltransferase
VVKSQPIDAQKGESWLRLQIKKLLKSLYPENGFLKKIPGVIHIGANVGQEREQYASLGLNVIWIEPIPAVFEELQTNIAAYPNQSAYRCLLADRSGNEYDFHIANNSGESSSILDLAEHKDIFPDIHFTHDIRITSTTLTDLIASEKIDLSKYGALVIDTQGSELLVLKGAIPVLSHFQFIKTEAANFEAYAGCCQLSDLTDFLGQHGFVISWKTRPLRRKGGGAYYDVVYKRRRSHGQG